MKNDVKLGISSLIWPGRGGGEGGVILGLMKARSYLSFTLSSTLFWINQNPCYRWTAPPLAGVFGTNTQSRFEAVVVPWDHPAEKQRTQIWSIPGFPSLVKNSWIQNFSILLEFSKNQWKNKPNSNSQSFATSVQSIELRHLLWDWLRKWG